MHTQNEREPHLQTYSSVIIVLLTTHGVTQDRRKMAKAVFGGEGAHAELWMMLRLEAANRKMRYGGPHF